LLFGLHAAPAWAADRYVSNSGSGSACTRASPCRQIYIAAQVAGPGDVIHIGDGIYEGGFQTVRAGAYGKPITYKADSKWGAVVSAQKSDGSSSFGWDQRGDYVIIDGIAVNGGSTYWYVGIYNSGKSSIVQNTHISDIAFSGSCPSSGGAGIESEGYWGDDQIQVLNNVIERIGPSSVRCITVHGIYITGKAMKAHGNVIRQPSGWCIASYHNTSDNDFSNNACNSSHYGCYSVGVQSGYANYNSLMAYNNCQECGQYGYNKYDREGPVVNLRVTGNQVSSCPYPWDLGDTPHTP